MPENATDLELFKFDACPFCVRVMQVIKELNIPVRMRDTRMESGARQELIDVGGSSQVPCLLINGKPLYESRDIVSFLRQLAPG